MASRTPYSKIAPAGGAYRISLKSGATTVLNAGDCVWSCRWTSTTLRAIIQKLRVNWVVTTAFDAAQLLDYGLYFARAFTATDSAGTASTLTGDNCKLDTNFPTTAFADIEIATAAAVTAGTRTLDSQPLVTRNGWATTTAGTVAADPNVEYQFGTLDATNPITLRADEGLALNVLTTMGASGVVRVYVEMEWTEVPVNLA
ncbi:MAG: hypothetical protein WC455_16075 [Dehalococcoidia bacterium]